MDGSDLLVKDPEKLEEIYFVAYTIIARTILVIGILGNVLSIIVLTRPNMKVSFIIFSIHIWGCEFIDTLRVHIF